MTEAREVPPMDKWLCVRTDPPPKDGTEVLMAWESDGKWFRVVGCWRESRLRSGLYGWHVSTWEKTDFEFSCNPTHWDHIPPPPQEPTHG